MRYTVSGSLAALLALFFMGVAGCDNGPKSSKGFRLPDGDVAKGKAAFLELKCTKCHTVSGTDLPKPDGKVGPVALGGEVTRIRTYGQLVTMVINPSHSFAEGYPEKNVSENGTSKMPNFNATMTVQQMIDLVAFLQAHYKIKPPPDYEYPYPYGVSSR